MTKAEFKQKKEDYFDEWWDEIEEGDKAYYYSIEEEWRDINHISVEELNDWWNNLDTISKAELCKYYLYLIGELDEDFDLEE